MHHPETKERWGRRTRHSVHHPKTEERGEGLDTESTTLKLRRGGEGLHTESSTLRLRRGGEGLDTESTTLRLRKGGESWNTESSTLRLRRGGEGQDIESLTLTLRGGGGKNRHWVYHPETEERGEKVIARIRIQTCSLLIKKKNLVSHPHGHTTCA